MSKTNQVTPTYIWLRPLPTWSADGFNPMLEPIVQHQFAASMYEIYRDIYCEQYERLENEEIVLCKELIYEAVESFIDFADYDSKSFFFNHRNELYNILEAYLTGQLPEIERRSLVRLQSANSIRRAELRKLHLTAHAKLENKQIFLNNGYEDVHEALTSDQEIVVKLFMKSYLDGQTSLHYEHVLQVVDGKPLNRIKPYKLAQTFQHTFFRIHPERFKAIFRKKSPGIYELNIPKLKLP